MVGVPRNGHRWYDPSIGRFLSRDPAKDGRNWFAYCSNDPISLVDGNGKDPISPWKLGVGNMFAFLGYLATGAAIAAVWAAQDPAALAVAYNLVTIANVLNPIATTLPEGTAFSTWAISSLMFAASEIVTGFMYKCGLAGTMFGVKVGAHTLAGCAVLAAFAYQMLVTSYICSIDLEAFIGST